MKVVPRFRFRADLLAGLTVLALCSLTFAACGSGAASDPAADAAAPTKDAQGQPDAAVPPCQIDEHVEAGECAQCPAGTERPAGDDPSQGDTACAVIECAENEHVVNGACASCAAGSFNEAGDPIDGGDTECVPGCLENQRVSDKSCVACPEGASNEAGDNPLANNTLCDTGFCAANEHVVSNTCVPCDGASENLAGDNPAGGDTSCDGALCPANYAAQDGACQACAAGSVQGAGDDPSQGDTSCCEIASVWGAGTALGQASGEFAEAFVQSTTGAPFALESWTALTKFESSGSVSPGNAYWVRNLTGVSQGAYAGSAPTTMASPSQANGVALFDSDFLDNGGIQGSFGTGTSPSPHRGELISPRIDASSTAGTELSLKFHYKTRGFAITTLAAQLSTDDGVTWGNDRLVPFSTNSELEGVMIVPLNLDGVIDRSSLRVRFVFDGDYYYAMFDDLSLQTCHIP